MDMKLGRLKAIASLVILIATALVGLPAAAGIFDDGNDRLLLTDLRKKPASVLTDEERAILRAADRYGNIGICAASGGNASLIRVNGRDAIITSLHMIQDSQTGAFRCSPDAMERARYAPNAAYYDAEVPHPLGEEFTLRYVALDPEPLYPKPARKLGGGSFHPGDDWAVFFLREEISSDIMPDGHVRGAFEILAPEALQKAGSFHMIGIAPDIREGLAVIYQTCEYRVMTGTGAFQHTCDSIRGSSGSFMGAMTKEGLSLAGLMTSGYRDPQPMPLPANHYSWNGGTLVPPVRGEPWPTDD
jgi:hypothetical protein